MGVSRYLIWLLVFVAIFVPSLEGLLWVFDPLGIVMFSDFQTVGRHLEGDPIFYWLPEGEYKQQHWQMTILDDHSRRVPDTNPDADCTVAAIGDSVTLGWGVEDNETWVNLLAQEFPDVNFINAGLHGYSSRHVMISQDEWLDQADGFIYFINPNDVNDGTQFQQRLIPMGSYLGSYLMYAVDRSLPRNEDSTFTHFWFDLSVIFAHQNTLIFIDDPRLAFQIERRLPGVVNLIPEHRTRISPVDPHPTAEGHQHIASAMRLQVEQAIGRWCVS